MQGFCNVVLLIALVAFTMPVRADAPMSPLRPIDTPNPKPDSTSGPTAAGGAAAAASPAKTATPQAPEEKGKNAATAQAAPPAPAAVATVRDSGIGGLVKPGRWQFTTHLMSSAQSSPVAGLEPPPANHPGSASGIGSTYTECVGAKDVIPAAFGGQCKLDSESHSGSRITWSMTCSQTHVHLQGVAQYHGDTMDATVLSQLAGSGGTVTNLTQHIAGHYLGSCSAEAAATPAKLAAVPAQQDAAAPATQTTEAGPHPIPHAERRRYARRRFVQRRYPHYYAVWGSSGGVIGRGASFGGPSPYSNGGP